MGLIVETAVFGNLEPVSDPKVLIIPAPYEYTTSYIKGTKNGPQAILNASIHLSSFDDELWADLSSVGINTNNFVLCEFVSNKTTQPFNELEQVVKNSVIGGSLPVVIGGENTVSYGSIKALYDLYPDISVLHFGAHSNLRSSFKDNKFNHTCTMRQVLDSMPEIKLVQVGIRNISREEADWLQNENPKVDVYFAKDRRQFTTGEILSSLKKNVYISFDFGVLDPVFMPSVLEPVPGGMSFEQVADILKNVCAFKDIIGMDFVGLTPIHGFYPPDFLAAKLIYKTIGYVFAKELGAQQVQDQSLVGAGL